MPRTAVPKPDAKLVTVRTQGIQLLDPIRHAVADLEISDNESYLEADGLLGRIRTNRKIWAEKMRPILSPLEVAVRAAKDALDASKGLFKEVDSPMESAELQVKAKMKTFKLEEARQLEAARVRAEQEAADLRAREIQAERAESQAKTARMKAFLATKRQSLQTQADEAEAAIDTIAPVKGASSASRTVKKIRIVDLMALLGSMQDYEPQAEIYKKGHPPASLIKPEMLQVALNKIYNSQPGTVLSWPGVEEYEDIIIAGR